MSSKGGERKHRQKQNMHLLASSDFICTIQGSSSQANQFCYIHTDASFIPSCAIMFKSQTPMCTQSMDMQARRLFPAKNSARHTTTTWARHHENINEPPPAKRKTRQTHHQKITSTPPKHEQDTSQTWPRHGPNITGTPKLAKTPPKHERSNTQTWPRHHQSTTDNVPLKHDRDTT